MLSSLSDVAKEKQDPEVVCPVCGERHRVIKHGFYRRYLFSGDETIRIQRYRCYNGRCPRRTFSILPHPLLPVWRVPLCFLLTLLALHEGSGHAINALARATATTWSTLRRRIAAARRLRPGPAPLLERIYPGSLSRFFLPLTITTDHPHKTHIA